MNGRAIAALTLTLVAAASCSLASRQSPDPNGAAPNAAGTLAQVIYWRARPGKFDEYSRYIRESAEPIDAEAHRRGAFLSITTYVSRDTASQWTHMRVFILRDSAQLRGLNAQLDSAGMRLEPDSTKRRARSTYSATLRDRVGTFTVELLR